MFSHHSRRKNTQGFTLVEALITVVIVVVLAAISVPIFLGQKEKARQAVAKQDGAQWSTELSIMLADATALGTCPTPADCAISMSAPSNGVAVLTIPLGTGYQPSTLTSPMTVDVNISSGTTFEGGSIRPSSLEWCFVVNNNNTGDLVFNQSGYQPDATACVAGVVS